MINNWIFEKILFSYWYLVFSWCGAHVPGLGYIARHTIMSCFFLSSFLHRTWSLLVRVSPKQVLWLWRISPRTATTTCSPVSHCNKSTSAALNSNTPRSFSYIIAYRGLSTTIIHFGLDIKSHSHQAFFSAMTMFRNTLWKFIQFHSFHIAENWAWVQL